MGGLLRQPPSPKAWENNQGAAKAAERPTSTSRTEIPPDILTDFVVGGFPVKRKVELGGGSERKVGDGGQDRENGRAKKGKMKRITTISDLEFGGSGRTDQGPPLFGHFAKRASSCGRGTGHTNQMRVRACCAPVSAALPGLPAVNDLSPAGQLWN